MRVFGLALGVASVLAGSLAASGVHQEAPARGVHTMAPTTASVTGQPGKTAADRVGGCAVFPADNYWNTDISKLPVDPRSATWMKHMSPRVDLHPDFGPSYGAQPVPYGIPITVVGGGHPMVHVHFHYGSESDRVRYPLGSDTKIEGGRRAGGDRHALIVDSSTCKLYETFATYHRHGRWTAGSGAVFKLNSNRLRPDGWTSADAAGLPIMPGLLRLSEVKAGFVNHAIRFTTDLTSMHHIWPARHDAGSKHSRDYPPMGARFRLKAGFSLKGFAPSTKVVLRAFKTYGLVLADNGSPWYFQGQAVRGWPAKMIEQLKTIPARAFQAVDTRPLEVKPGSGATS